MPKELTFLSNEELEELRLKKELGVKFETDRIDSVTGKYRIYSLLSDGALVHDVHTGQRLRGKVK